MCGSWWVYHALVDGPTLMKIGLVDYFLKDTKLEGGWGEEVGKVVRGRELEMGIGSKSCLEKITE